MLGWLIETAAWEILPVLALGPLGAILAALRVFARLPWRFVLGIGAVGLVLIGLWAYDRQRHRIAFLEEDNRRLVEAVETQEATIDELQSIIVNWRLRYEALQDALLEQERIAREAQERAERTREELENDGLTDRATTEPDAVEDLLNQRTLDAMRRLRCASEPSGDDCG